jgi:hypothetical protein
MPTNPSLLSSSNPAQGTQLSSGNTQYDSLVPDAPGIEPVAGSEEPDQAEQGHYDILYADFMAELYDNNSERVLKILENKQGETFFQGVSDAAFHILKAVHTKHVQKEGPVPPASLFGEGGMLHTAVDEVFAFAQAYGLQGSNAENQYTAAQMDIMRQAGEYLEKSSDDSAISEAQDLMLDIDEAGGGGDHPGVAPSDRRDLAAIEYQDEVAQEELQAGPAGQGPLPGDPEAAEGQPDPTAPQNGGLV